MEYGRRLGGFVCNERAIPFVLLALMGVVCCWVFIASLGYGAYPDTFKILRTWKVLMEYGMYQPSRFQGYLIPEMVLGFVAANVGYAGSNGVVIVLSVATLSMAAVLLRDFVGWRQALLAVLFIAANPYFATIAAETSDYIFPFFFFASGLLLLRRDLVILAALAFACAVSSRLTFAPMGLCALGFQAWLVWCDRERRRTAMLAIAVFLMMSALFYLPVFIASNMTLSFLTATQPHENYAAARVARFIYKQILLFGWIGSACVVAVLAHGVWVWRRGRVEGLEQDGIRHLLWMCGAVILYTQCIFFGLPARIVYLLPILASLAVILAVLVRRPAVWAVLIGAEFLIWWVQPDIVRISYAEAGSADCPVGATIPTGMTLVPHIRTGVIIQEVRDIPRAVCLLKTHHVEEFR